MERRRVIELSLGDAIIPHMPHERLKSGLPIADALFRIYFHPQSRLLVQSRGGLLFETHPFRPAAYPRRFQARDQDRLIAAVGYFDRDPEVHTWTSNLDRAA
jgi:hypothetical protein